MGDPAFELLLSARTPSISQPQIALTPTFRYGRELAPVAANFHRFASPGR